MIIQNIFFDYVFIHNLIARFSMFFYSNWTIFLLKVSDKNLESEILGLLDFSTPLFFFSVVFVIFFVPFFFVISFFVLIFFLLKFFDDDKSFNKKGYIILGFFFMVSTDGEIFAFSTLAELDQYVMANQAKIIDDRAQAVIEKTANNFDVWNKHLVEEHNWDAFKQSWKESGMWDRHDLFPVACFNENEANSAVHQHLMYSKSFIMPTKAISFNENFILFPLDSQDPAGFWKDAFQKKNSFVIYQDNTKRWFSLATNQEIPITTSAFFNELFSSNNQDILSCKKVNFKGGLDLPFYNIKIGDSININGMTEYKTLNLTDRMTLDEEAFDLKALRKFGKRSPHLNQQLFFDFSKEMYFKSPKESFKLLEKESSADSFWVSSRRYATYQKMFNINKLEIKNLIGLLSFNENLKSLNLMSLLKKKI
jgi:hypothetical protein